MGRKRIVIEVSGTANTVTGDMLVIGRLGCRSELVGTVVKVEDVPPEEEKVVPLNDRVMKFVDDPEWLENARNVWTDYKRKMDALINPPAPDPLKKCPFCGGDGLRSVNEIIDGTAFVGCLKCETSGPSGVTEAEARAAWNRRVTP